MMKITIRGIALAAMAILLGCESLPGADGRYATFDRGRSNNRALLVEPSLPLM